MVIEAQGDWIYWIQRGARFWCSSKTHPAPPFPPPQMSTFHFGFIFRGKWSIWLYLCQRLNKRREVPGTLGRCVVSDLRDRRRWWWWGVFLEPPHHNRTTNPDPQDGHGQDGREGEKQQQRGRRRKAASQGWWDDARGGRRGDIQTPPPPGAGFALRLPPSSIRRF